MYKKMFNLNEVQQPTSHTYLHKDYNYDKIK